MSFSNLFLQIILGAVSVGIFVTFVYPTFQGIGERQDEIERLRGEISKVSTVNQNLVALTGRLNSLDTDEIAKLETYLPVEFDTIRVPRDLAAIVGQAGLLLSSVTLAEFVDAGYESGSYLQTRPSRYKYDLEVIGTYEQTKQLLLLLQANEYALSPTTASMQLVSGGFISSQISLEMYEFTWSEPEEQ